MTPTRALLCPLACAAALMLTACALPRDVPSTPDGQRNALLERFGRDQAVLDSLARVPSVRASHDWSRAQCFVRHAYSELHGRDAAGFTPAALTQAEALLASIQAGRPGGPTELINHRERMRPDLWAVAERTRSNSCAAATAGCLEVQLVRAGHEYHTMGWRHATSYFAIAEDMADQASREAASCAPPPAPLTPSVAPPSPTPPPPPATPEVRRSTLTLGADVLFRFNRHGADQVLLEGRRQLDDAADKIKAVDLVSVRVIGHTDPEGSAAYNERLSLQRAETIKALLVARGVPADKIGIEGRGKRETVANCDRRKLKGEKLNACNQPNRRVVIEFAYRER
jgi:outer membrane protein OmpA-like peptidoglycan-associated protein